MTFNSEPDVTDHMVYTPFFIEKYAKSKMPGDTCKHNWFITTRFVKFPNIQVDFG